MNDVNETSLWEARFTTEAFSSDSGFDDIYVAISKAVDTIEQMSRISTATQDGTATYTVRLQALPADDARQQISVAVATKSEPPVEFHSFRLAPTDESE